MRLRPRDVSRGEGGNPSSGKEKGSTGVWSQAAENWVRFLFLLFLSVARNQNQGLTLIRPGLTTGPHPKTISPFFTDVEKVAQEKSGQGKPWVRRQGKEEVSVPAICKHFFILSLRLAGSTGQVTGQPGRHRETQCGKPRGWGGGIERE